MVNFYPISDSQSTLGPIFSPTQEEILVRDTPENLYSPPIPPTPQPTVLVSETPIPETPDTLPLPDSQIVPS